MSKYEKLKQIIPDMVKKYGIKNVVAEIHNLYQDYMIDETQEEELYIIADPEGKFNYPSKYWFDECGCSEMYDFVDKNS